MLTAMKQMKVNLEADGEKFTILVDRITTNQRKHYRQFSRKVAAFCRKRDALEEAGKLEEAAAASEEVNDLSEAMQAEIVLESNPRAEGDDSTAEEIAGIAWIADALFHALLIDAGLEEKEASEDVPLSDKPE